MLWRDIATLIKTEEIEDEDGYSETVIVEEKQIFVNEKSVKRSEFYAAKQTGIDVVITFEVQAVDYSNETLIKYRNTAYRVIRVYTKSGEILELNCALASLPGTVARGRNK